MNLFDVARLFSPVAGAYGGAFAVYRSMPHSNWMWIAGLFGFVCGFFGYRAFVRCVIGRHDKNPDLPTWRVVSILIGSAVSPWAAAAFSFLLVRTFLHLVA